MQMDGEEKFKAIIQAVKDDFNRKKRGILPKVAPMSLERQIHLQQLKNQDKEKLILMDLMEDQLL